MRGRDKELRGTHRLKSHSMLCKMPLFFPCFNKIPSSESFFLLTLGIFVFHSPEPCLIKVQGEAIKTPMEVNLCLLARLPLNPLFLKTGRKDVRAGKDLREGCPRLSYGDPEPIEARQARQQSIR